MGFQEALDFIVGADGVKIEQPAVSGEHKTQGESMPAFIKAPAQGADACPAVGMRLAKGIAHALEQCADFLSLRFGECPQDAEQIGIELNLQSLSRYLRRTNGLSGI